MRYHNITHDDMLNGEGLRVTLWVSGCEHHCKNCQNPCTWDKDSGLEFDENARREIFDQLSQDYISGITFCGGDPLAKYNRDDVFRLMCEIKARFPKKNIWCYTGYTLAELKEDPEIEYLFNVIDVLVDGRYVDELNDVNYHWAGSTNQAVIRFDHSNENRPVYDGNFWQEVMTESGTHEICVDPSCYSSYTPSKYLPCASCCS